MSPEDYQATYARGVRIDTPSPRNTALPAIVPGNDEWSAFTGNIGGSIGALSERTAMTVSAIYACVNLIGGAISGLPLLTYRWAAGRPPERIDDDPLWWILNEQFSPRWSAPVAWEALIQSLLLPGDAFARIMRSPFGQITGLEPLRWERVTVYVHPDGSRLIYSVSPDPYVPTPSAGAVQQVYDQDDILHIPGFGFDGRRGLSPLRYALRTAGTVANATQTYSAEFFQNNARPDYYYQTDQLLDDEQVQRMKDTVALNHATVGNRHAPAILTGGFKVIGVQLPFEDLQMLETRRFQVEEIARIYGVPPFMIGHNEKTTSWGSGVEAMGIGFVKYALRQHLTKIEAEINRKLFRNRGRFIAFDTHALERADLKTRADAWRVLVGRAGEQGIVSPDEARREFMLPPAEGGDKLFSGGAANAGGPPEDITPPPTPNLDEQ